MIKINIDFKYVKNILPMHPIVFISTACKNGIDNIAPYATCVDIGYNPPVISFASSKVKHSNISKNNNITNYAPQDTFLNIKETKKFIINVPGINLVDRMSILAENYDRDVDEFKISGLTKIESSYYKNPHLAPKLIMECLAHLECELIKIIDIKSCDHFLIIGEVKNLMVNKCLGKNIIEIRDNLITQVFGNLRANSINTRLIGKIVPFETDCIVYNSDLDIIKAKKSSS